MRLIFHFGTPKTSSNKTKRRTRRTLILQNMSKAQWQHEIEIVNQHVVKVVNQMRIWVKLKLL